MSKFRNVLIGTALVSSLASLAAAPAFAEKLGLGRPALPEEVAAWNLDVSPDGTGLPEGSGSVEDGEVIFSENCAICHGEFAEGVDNWPKLAGGDGTLDHKDPLKTVGSYWPYLSTAFDYVHRSMPFGQAQTMTPDQTYAIVAYILYSNDLVDDDFVLSKENFLEVEMPNADGFIIDDREEAEKAFWTEPCMENCKPEPVKITMKAAVLDVTPDEGAAEGEGEEAAATEAAEPASAPAEAAPAAVEEETKAAEPAAEPVKEEAAVDPALVEAGAKVFKKCKACHQVGADAKNRVGPVLNNILDRPFASVDDFKYGKGIKEMADQGMVWSEANLHAYLTKPKDFIKGTKMSFAGLKKDEEITAVIAYIEANSN